MVAEAVEAGMAVLSTAVAVVADRAVGLAGLEVAVGLEGLEGLEAVAVGQVVVVALAVVELMGNIPLALRIRFPVFYGDVAIKQCR
jgi:hypothetical protein